MKADRRNPLKIAAWQEAVDRLEAEEGRPAERRRYRMPSSESFGEIWGRSSVLDRQRMLQMTLLENGPVSIEPNPRRQSRAGVNLERLRLPAVTRATAEDHASRHDADEAASVQPNARAKLVRHGVLDLPVTEEQRYATSRGRR